MNNDKYKLQLPLGLYDDPAKQRKANFSYDLYNSNLAVFGSALSGKTTLLKTLLLRIHQISRKSPQAKQNTPLDEQIYILDFGNTLQNYDKLPCVAVCLSGMIDENVRRIFKIMEDIYNRNLFARQKQNEITTHTTFIVDGLDVFMEEERYSRYQDFLIRIARDGLSARISVIMTAAQFSGKMLKLRASMGCVIAFDLPTDVYTTLYSHKVSKPIQKPGRGVVNDGTSVYEFQAYLPYDISQKNTTEEEILQDVIDAYYFQNRYEPADVDQSILENYRKKFDSRKLEKLPDAENFTLEELEKLTQKHSREPAEKQTEKPDDKLRVPLGIDFYSFERIDLEISWLNAIALYGSRFNEKCRLLTMILKGVINSQNGMGEILIWDDGNQTLTKYLEKYGTLTSDSAVNNKHVTVTKNMDFLKKLNEFENLKSVLEGTSYWDALTSETSSNKTSETSSNAKTPLIVLIHSREGFMADKLGEVGGIWVLSRLLMYGQFKRKLLFIFTNVPMIASIGGNNMFQSILTHAFLLDDIVPFVNGNGRDTCFSSNGVKELNEMFGLCEESDGFYMNVESYDLHKVRFIQDKESKNGSK